MQDLASPPPATRAFSGPCRSATLEFRRRRGCGLSRQRRPRARGVPVSHRL